jgi:hypothetical protein
VYERNDVGKESMKEGGNEIWYSVAAGVGNGRRSVQQISARRLTLFHCLIPRRVNIDMEGFNAAAALYTKLIHKFLLPNSLNLIGTASLSSTHRFIAVTQLIQE